MTARAAKSVEAKGRAPKGRIAPGESRQSFAAAVQPFETGERPALQRKCACGGGCPDCRAEAIQPKLTIGAPDDRFEREADQVADRIMRMPDASEPRLPGGGMAATSGYSAIPSITPLVQRQPEPEDAEMPEEEPVQAKSLAGADASASTDLQSRIGALSGRGKPLSEDVRSFFEPRLGRDLGDVRVHTDSNAAETARSVNARAFTLRNDVVFNSGEYAPDSSEGRRLLAHELTHVVQQQGGGRRIQRMTDQVVECHRDPAQACLVHLHGDERNALQVATDSFCNRCVNLIHLTNGPSASDPRGCRLLRFDVTIGSRQTTCCADPNRIFTDSLMDVTSGGSWNDAGWRSNWRRWNARGSRPACGCNPHGLCDTAAAPTPAAAALRAFRDNSLLPALIRCAVSVSFADSFPIPEVTVRPIVALHNNTNNPRGSRRLSIRSYLSGGRERRATATFTSSSGRDRPRLVAAAADLTSNPGASGLRPGAIRARRINPHVQRGQDVDDFILVTDKDDFVFFVREGRNVVLQAVQPNDDGSLSVALSLGRYVNLEAQRGHLATQQAMAGETFRQLGVNPASGGVCPPSNGNDPRCPTCPPGSNTGPSQAPGGSSGRIQRTPLPDVANEPSERTDPATADGLISRTPAPRIQRQSNPLTERDLPSPTARGLSRAQRDRRTFMREVYRRQVAIWMAQGATYLHEVAAADRVTLPASYAITGRTISVHTGIESNVRSMIDDARAALAGASGPGGPASGVTGLGVRSGYRSAQSQFTIWTTWAPVYYRRTRADRRDTTRFPGGEHSPAAAQFLAEYTNRRVFSPGFSPHQKATAVDLAYREPGGVCVDGNGWAKADSSATCVSNWKRTWFFRWLRRNAIRYGFLQNPNIDEPWHWEYRPVTAFLIRIILWLLRLLERLLGDPGRWTGDDEEPGTDSDEPQRQDEPAGEQGETPE